MSVILRAREEAAIARIAAALDFTLDATRLRADELEEMAALIERSSPSELRCNGVFPDEIDEDPEPGIAHGHPFHFTWGDTVVRGRVDPACVVELETKGLTVNEVFDFCDGQAP